MIANELLAQLRTLTRNDPEPVPKGWKDAHAWAKEFGLKRRATDALLARGVRAGMVERRKFRINVCGQVRIVAHYRPSQARR